jgi:hypothetical protein
LVVVFGLDPFSPIAVDQLGVGQDPTDVASPKRLLARLTFGGLRLVDVDLPGEHSARLRRCDGDRHGASTTRPGTGVVFGVDMPPVVATGAIEQAITGFASCLAVGGRSVMDGAF